jgi:hypothetical protein
MGRGRVTQRAASSASSSALGLLGGAASRPSLPAPDTHAAGQQLRAAEGPVDPRAAVAGGGAAACAASYLLVSPSWQPLVGRSRQHLKMEHEVRRCRWQQRMCVRRCLGSACMHACAVTIRLRACRPSHLSKRNSGSRPGMAAPTACCCTHRSRRLRRRRCPSASAVRRGCTSSAWRPPSTPWACSSR